MNPPARLESIDLLHNPVFLSAIFSLFIAQFIKVLINILRPRAKGFRDVLVTFLWRTGGMPSSHSALAVSIATSVAFVEGPNSSVCILAIFFALVVIRDAMGVRRAAGQQARVLNLISKELSSRFDLNFHQVKEVHGHSAAEVLVGSILGFSIALAFCTL
ncbi:MAG TPA: divergent PAP2 family protein [Rectinemataceae bacterium]|nr:divergent PAP2 family protein [Rectinemataceae bacterium]